jgi:hypothetical protein
MTSTIAHNLYGSYKAFVYEYVGADDLSTKKVLWHSWEEEVLAGKRVEVPRHKKDGKKKPDNGVLPIEHPSIIWLADKGHRVRQFSNKLFNLTGKNFLRGNKIGCRMNETKFVVHNSNQLLSWRRGSPEERC